MSKCKICKNKFEKLRPMQIVCSIECSFSYLAKKASEKEKLEKRKIKNKLRELKVNSRSLLIKKAQYAFNAYIRERDKNDNCICCGKKLWLEGATGGKFDAGHYRSVAAAPHLRFDERNVHGQRKYCNQYKAGNIQGYRLGLIAKIGLEEVESLENDQSPKHYSKDDLIYIRELYRNKLKKLSER